MVDRTLPPAIHEIKDLKLPEFQKTTLSKDIPLGFIVEKAHQVIILNLIIPSGAIHEPIEGVTYFTAKMLSEGTSSLDSYQIASKIDFYGGHLEISPAPDHVSIKLYALKKFFPELLALLQELLIDSQFPEKEFDTMKEIRIQHIRQQMARNIVVASLKFRNCLFGDKHPYGRLIDESRVEPITLDNAVDYYRHGFMKKPVVYIAGNVDDAEIKLIDDYFSGIKYYGREGQALPDPSTSEDVHIDREGSLQSSIRLGSIIIDRKDKDHLQLRIANELLGGFFGSRLMKNIREEKGLTYGIFSSFIHFNHFSFWQIGTDVMKEKKDEAVSEIIREIKSLQNNPPTKEELQTLKNYMRGKIASSFDTFIDSLEIIRPLDLLDIKPTYWQSLFNEIDSITAEEICDIAEKHFEIKKIRKVTVG